jgi:hypothetical protein
LLPREHDDVMPPADKPELLQRPRWNWCAGSSGAEWRTAGALTADGADGDASAPSSRTNQNFDRLSAVTA